MLATLNSRQIVDEIVKDTVNNNDPHDAVQISPDVVLASRVSSEAPTLAPEFTARPEPKFAPGAQKSSGAKGHSCGHSCPGAASGCALGRHRRARDRERRSQPAEAIGRREVVARGVRHLPVCGWQCCRNHRLGEARRHREADARRMDTGSGVAVAIHAVAIHVADSAGRSRTGRAARRTGSGR